MSTEGSIVPVNIMTTLTSNIISKAQDKVEYLSKINSRLEHN